MARWVYGFLAVVFLISGWSQLGIVATPFIVAGFIWLAMSSD